ncbi:zinc finger CCCH domain-containing protein 11A [Aulostomus maculatus]
MTNHGDDCYFYYYSTCTKGDACPFRHCEAAMGNETVCNLWQEGRCFRTVCKFRHMEIKKNRKVIQCYWENQPAGCQKPHCAFFHEKPRYIEGIFVPPDKSQRKNEEQPQEEPAPLPATPLPTAANPQLRGVKTESQEPVPSPTHPPVVINPADDDEDEDDQYSEEGEDGRVGPPPRKLPKSDDSLNFGVSTLEEIRLRKALKASMKRAEYPMQSADTTDNGEKENIQSFFQSATYMARDAPRVFEETGRSRGSVADRLGRKMPDTNVNSVGGVTLKRSITERLGTFVDGEESLMPPKKVLKPIKDRLGLPPDPVAATQTGAETSTGANKTSGQIRIKTLEEIRLEKAAKSKSLSPSHEASETSINKTIPAKTIPTKTTKSLRRAIAIQDHSIRTCAKILHTNRKRQDEQQEQNGSPKKAGVTAEGTGSGSDPEASKGGEVRVKTLEEIRREKAARNQAQQVLEAESKKHPNTDEKAVKKPRLLRMKKQPSQNDTTTKSGEANKPVRDPAAAAPETGTAAAKNVLVKTFEEIMQEKRLRKQERAEQASSSSQGPEPGFSSPSSSTVVPNPTPSTPSLPIRKLIPLKSKVTSPQNSTAAPLTTAAAVTAVTSVPVVQSSSPQQVETHSQTPSSSNDFADKNTKSSTAMPPTKRARGAPQGSTAERPPADKTPPSHTKVRPKLNVKPSVMKPAVQVKPGQKRRGAGRSAVAAVKPLNSTSAVVEEPLQEMASREAQVFTSQSAEVLLISAVPHSPSSSSSPLGEELQTVPEYTQSPRKEACTLPQSPVQKTPAQAKARRQSVAAARTISTSSTAASTSAVDDFEELINEFTDDRLEEDVDPGIGEDDLLQELSDMIDS